jgi:hypothetical protein
METVCHGLLRDPRPGARPAAVTTIPDPLVFYFFNDPFRWLGLMIKELLLGLVALIGLCLINGIVTWRYRFQVYDVYLSLKYRIKNKIFERKYPVFDHFKDEL